MNSMMPNFHVPDMENMPNQFNPFPNMPQIPLNFGPPLNQLLNTMPSNMNFPQMNTGVILPSQMNNNNVQLGNAEMFANSLSCPKCQREI